MIDWRSLLARSGVEYVESGPNVHKGWIGVHCPWCGSADPSQHLVIRENGRNWKCWRNPGHSGRDPAKLVSALMRIDYGSAQRLLGPEFTVLPDDFAAEMKSKLGAPQPVVQAVLELPEEFKPLQDLPSARRYVEYLERRMFYRSRIWRMTEQYGLRYATRGDFHGRLIFPVERHGALMGWTGRTIYPNEKLRYKSTGSLQHLLWFDQLKRSQAETICLCEGPFDALKVSTLGERLGVVATCFFTAAPTQAQVDLLHELLPRFRNRYLLLDHDATATALRVWPTLSSLGVKQKWLPASIKDPGELDMPSLTRLVG